MTVNRVAGVIALSAAVVVAGLVDLLSARAEPVAEGRPTHLRLGGVSAAANDTRLPRDKVQVAWRTHVNGALRGPALVRSGEPTVVTDPKTGTLAFLGAGGAIEQSVAVSSQGIVGSPLRLADGTVVAVTGTGDVVGYRRDQLRFRVSVGAVHAVPLLLALDDGGFVLGLDAELVAFDGRGGLRGRATVSDRLAGELVGFDGKIAAVTSSGMVVLWVPGGELRAVGELGHAGPVIVGGERTITAISDDARIVDLDVVTREVRTREEARGAALFLGAPLPVRVPARSFAVTELDGSRLSALVYPRSPLAPGATEPRRVHLATLPTVSNPDAGAAPPPGKSGLPGSSRAPSSALPAMLFAPSVDLVADASGAFAFAVAGGGLGPGGIVGIAEPASGTVTTLERTLCGSDPGTATPTVPSASPLQARPVRPGDLARTDVAGLAIGRDLLVVTCGSGDVVALSPQTSAVP